MVVKSYVFLFRMKTFFILFMWLFAFTTIVDSNGDEAPLAKWLEMVLELGNESSSERSSIGKPPQYVQELYDMVTYEDELEQKRLVEGADNELLTIQAIRHDRVNDSFIETNAEVQFSLNKLWVKGSRMARAELVFGLRHESLSVRSNINSVVVSLSSSDGTGTEFRSIIRQNFVNDATHFDRDFFVVPITSIMKKLISGSKSSTTLKVRLNTELMWENGTVGSVDARETSRRFHLSSNGRLRPLLVLYSSEVDSPLSSAERGLKRMRRRHVDEGNGANRQYANDAPSTAALASGANCALHTWTVNINGLLMDRIIRPHLVKVNYCSGSCPFPAFDAHWNATNNAVIRNSFLTTRHTDEGGGGGPTLVPDARCVPLTFQPIVILFVEGDNNYVMRRLENVVATSCMCA